MIKKQAGATLVIVLILLVLITIIGTLAIRSSLTAYNIATNSQAQQLLIQNSDAAIFNVEDPKTLNRHLAQDGLFGFVKSDENKGSEVVFCYKGAQVDFFTLNQASIMKWESGAQPSFNTMGTNGYCKLNNDNFFTSGRKAVMTQVAIKVPPTGNNPVTIENPFEYSQLGTDAETAKIDNAHKVMVITTSIVPALSSASDTEINDCFSKHMSHVVVPSGVTPATGMDKSVSECLQALGVPVNTQVVEYNLIQAFNRS